MIGILEAGTQGNVVIVYYWFLLSIFHITHIGLSLPFSLPRAILARFEQRCQISLPLLNPPPFNSNNIRPQYGTIPRWNKSKSCRSWTQELVQRSLFHWIPTEFTGWRPSETVYVIFFCRMWLGINERWIKEIGMCKIINHGLKFSNTQCFVNIYYYFMFNPSVHYLS
jgi:hypothetical protein